MKIALIILAATLVSTPAMAGRYVGSGQPTTGSNSIYPSPTTTTLPLPPAPTHNCIISTQTTCDSNGNCTVQQVCQ